MIELNVEDLRRIIVLALPVPIAATLGLFSAVLGWLFFVSWFAIVIGWKLGVWIRSRR